MRASRGSVVIVAGALLAALGLLACGGGGGGDEQPPQDPPQEPRTGVIDGSVDSRMGYTFGYKTADQWKRFQVFTAGDLPNITGVEVKIRKNVATEIVGAITAELFEVGADHKPTTSLALADVDLAPLTDKFNVLSAPLEYQGLVQGREYAIVLSQAVGSGANHGLEWCSITASGLPYHGKLENDAWKLEGFQAWLKVYVSN